MRITIDLSDQHATQLRTIAEALGIEPDKLAQALLADWLVQPQDDFRKAAAHVLQKNKELHQKLGEALDATNRKSGGALRRLAD